MNNSTILQIVKQSLAPECWISRFSSNLNALSVMIFYTRISMKILFAICTNWMFRFYCISILAVISINTLSSCFVIECLKYVYITMSIFFPKEKQSKLNSIHRRRAFTGGALFSHWQQSFFISVEIWMEPNTNNVVRIATKKICRSLDSIPHCTESYSFILTIYEIQFFA